MRFSQSTSKTYEEDEMRYVDRGDPAGWDKEIGDFIVGTTWRDMDLSAICPIEAANHLVHLRIYFETSSASNHVYQVRKKGNVNVINTDGIAITGIYDLIRDRSVWVMLDADRKIQYRVAGSTFTAINLTVRGWWIG
jgi:hypothetical protein